MNNTEEMTKEQQHQLNIDLYGDATFLSICAENRDGVFISRDAFLYHEEGFKLDDRFSNITDSETLNEFEELLDLDENTNMLTFF